MGNEKVSFHEGMKFFSVKKFQLAIRLILCFDVQNYTKEQLRSKHRSEVKALNAVNFQYDWFINLHNNVD